MNFGKAIEALKQGKKVTRKGWNGKKMFLYYVPAGCYPARTEIAKSIADEDGKVNYGSYIAMKTAQGNVVPWLASQTDMLSEDWEVVDTNETTKGKNRSASDQTILAIEKQIDNWKEEKGDKRGYVFLCFEDVDEDTGSMHCGISGNKKLLCEGFEQAMHKKDSDLRKIVLLSSILGMAKNGQIIKM